MRFLFVQIDGGSSEQIFYNQRSPHWGKFLFVRFRKMGIHWGKFFVIHLRFSSKNQIIHFRINHAALFMKFKCMSYFGKPLVQVFMAEIDKKTSGDVEG